MVVAHFTFEVNGRQTGLIRRTTAPGNLTIERMDDQGNWIDDPSLVRHFRDSVDLVEIAELEALQLAKSYGGRL